MFSNFEKAFSEKSAIEEPISKEIIASLSEKLPEGFEYKAVGDGSCGIVPNSSELKLGLNIKVPDDLLKDFKPSNVKELMEFMYRTQRDFKVITDQEGCISINGMKFKLEDFIKFPLEDITVGKEWFMRAQRFQPPFKVSLIGRSGISKLILMQRQPYADMHKSYFKSVDDNILEISYILDEKNGTIKFTLHINIEKSRSAKKIIDGFKIYQSLSKGEVTFAGIDFSKIITNEENVIEKTIEFWDKILKLEVKLDVEFSLDFPITIEDATLIEKLYRSFVEEKPYKQYVNLEKITLDNSGKLNKEELLNNKGIVLQMVQKSKQKIWGAELNMYDSIALCDLEISDIVLTKDMKKHELLLRPTTDKGIYESIRHFNKKEEASDYMKCTTDLKNAELIDID